MVGMRRGHLPRRADADAAARARAPDHVLRRRFAIAAVVIVVVVVNDVGVNGCVASASAPEVHVLPSQGRRRRASGGGGVFPRGRRRRRSDPTVVE